MCPLVVPVTTRDHVSGPAESSLTMVEYGDIECPHCALAHPIVRGIRDRLKDSLRFVFRHFPMTRIHPLAQKAAEAAEAAAAQGKFWEMLDVLYDNRDRLEDEALVKHAKKLGLDGKQFRKELEGGVYADRVRADMLGGVRSGVNGTPTFFINGVRHDGSWEFEPLVAALVKAGKAV